MVCLDAGWESVPERIQMLQSWHQKEGMPLEETWNPLATTQPLYELPNLGLNNNFNIGYGPGRWNNANAGGLEENRGVKVFDTPEHGASATARTILNGNFPNVVRCFQDLVAYSEAVVDLGHYIGSFAYSQALVSEWEGILADPRVDAIIETLNQSGIQTWKDNGNEPIILTITKILDHLARIDQSLQQFPTVDPRLPSAIDTVFGLNTLLQSWRGSLAAQGIIVP